MSFQQGVQSETRMSFSAQPIAASTKITRPGSKLAGQAPGGWASGPLATLGGAGSVDEMLSTGLLGTELGSA